MRRGNPENTGLLRYARNDLTEPGFAGMTFGRSMKQILIFTLILTLSLINSALANPPLQLHQLQTQIKQLRNILSNDQNQQTKIQRELRDTETKMGNTSIQMQQIQQQLIFQQTLLKNLNQQQLQYQNQINAQEVTLAQQLRAIYTLGQQQYLKVLLNQEDPNQLSRVLTYYHYINRRRLTLIAKFNQTLQQLNVTKQQIEIHKQQLTTLQNQQQNQQSQLEKIAQNREALLQMVTTQIHTKQQQLNILMANKAALERIVTRLVKQEQFRSVALPHMQLTHKFPWPTRGKLIQRFGASIQQSQLKSSGVLIAAPSGQNVYAVTAGRVVFSNWLSGYGLLLIIDDGNGLMMIYGRNHSLYKKVGDRVNAGDIIASVGNSGGYKKSALYFAIRKSGKPLNPELWCS